MACTCQDGEDIVSGGKMDRSWRKTERAGSVDHKRGGEVHLIHSQKFLAISTALVTLSSLLVF
jgi:hypothetical protein